MRKINIILFFLLFLVSCSTQRNIGKSKRQITEEEYFSTFTEATKHALIGNLKNALQLYQLCIQEFPERPASYYQVSSIYLTVKDLNRAKNYARKAVDLEKDNKWYLLHLASIYQYENNLDSLIMLYEDIVKLTDNSEYEYNLALFYTSNGDYKKSMNLVNKLETEFEGSREVFLLKHRNYAALDYQDSAIAQLEEMIYVFPDQFENYGMLAEYLSEINQFEKSKEIYKDLLLKQPNNGLANFSYGDFFIKQGQKDSALVYYKKGFSAEDIALEEKIGILYNYMYEGNSLSTDSTFILSLTEVLENKYNDPRPYTLTAEYYIKQEKYAQASLSLREAIDRGAENYVVWEQYLMISNFIGNHESVFEIYNEAISRFPEQINLYIYSGYSLYSLERYDSVLVLQDSGLAIKEYELPQMVQFMNVLADCYRELGKLVKSDSLYEEILILDPNNLLIRNNYSYYLSVREKDLERAEELSRLTVKKEPKNATYLDTYGWILFKMGRIKDAAKYIEAAIRNGAYNNAEVLDHYGDIMLALERYEEAIEAWNTAKEFDEERIPELDKKLEKVNLLIKND